MTTKASSKKAIKVRDLNPKADARGGAQLNRSACGQAAGRTAGQSSKASRPGPLNHNETLLRD